MSQNLKYNTNLTQLVLKRSGLTDLTLGKMVENFAPGLKRLDLSMNPALTLKSYKKIEEVLIEKKVALTHINMEGNGFGDASLETLCKMIH